MSAQNPNILSVELVVEALGSVCTDLVLVGGCAVGLLTTDKARPPVRATQDVDLITEVAALNDYYLLQDKLKERGFSEDGDVICRWHRGNLTIDVMPTKEIGFGSTNHWYPLVVSEAKSFQLPSGALIKLVTAPLFVATKLDSFHDRGNGDYAHHDIEDIVNVVDGRVELVEEVEAVVDVVRMFIRDEFDDLLADPTFIERLPWHLSGDASNQGRVQLIIERMRKLAGL
jgi:predicted nucleotidyltransferase